MITISEVKKACNLAVMKAFPNYKLYGTAVVDGYRRPAFFTEIIPKNHITESVYVSQNGATYKATFLEESHDEALCLEIYDRFREIFGAVFDVSGQKLIIDELSFDFIGEYSNILQITVDFAVWIDRRRRIETEELMQSVDMQLEQKG